MRRCRLLVLFLISLWSLPAWAQPPRVVVSIAPLHSLVAGVMAGVEQPRLLLPQGASPHTYAMLPSDARALRDATLVVWVGEGLEAFLRKPLATLSRDASLLTVAELPGLQLLPAREHADWNDDHHDHDHDHDHSASGQHDWHLWLDPRNAAVIVDAVAERLGRLDPANAARYRDNARALRARLDLLDRELTAALSAVRDQPYVVFHDAYQYFEHRYGLRSVGAITVNPERPPGARRVAELHRKLEAQGVRCLFREPQFESNLVQAIVRGTSVPVGVLDPEGATRQPGPELYFELMRDLAVSLNDCLGRNAGKAP